MTVLFAPIFDHRARKNLAALKLVEGLNLDQLNPGMPLSEGHMVMAYAYALASLGIRIGMGDHEVSPDEAMRALTTGLAECRAMATKDLREKAVLEGHTTLSDEQPG